MKLNQKIEQELEGKNVDTSKLSIPTEGIARVEEIIKVFSAHKRLYDRMRLNK